MNRKSLIACLALLLVAPLAAKAAEPYELDAAHSLVGFSAKHFGISTVRGEFGEFAATLMVDESEITGSAVEIRIPVATINTRNEQRDGHLRSADFLDAANHPEIVFRSRAIERIGDGEYLMTGDLTIRGATREVEIPFTLAGPITDPYGMKRLGAEGGLTIDRQDFGVNWSRLMDNGGLVVSDDVEIEFSLEATRPAAAPPEG